MHDMSDCQSHMGYQRKYFWMTVTNIYHVPDGISDLDALQYFFLVQSVCFNVRGFSHEIGWWKGGH